MPQRFSTSVIIESSPLPNNVCALSTLDYHTDNHQIHKYLYLLPNENAPHGDIATLITANTADDTFDEELESDEYEVSLFLTVYFRYPQTDPHDKQIENALMLYCQGYTTALREHNTIRHG